MSGIVEIQPAGISCPDVTSHFRAAVTGAAANLASFITGAAWPTFDSRKPDMVYIGAEAANTGTIIITWDGKTTPTATLGFVVPTLPNFLLISKKNGSGLELGDIKVLASAATQYAQVKTEWSQA